MHFVSIGEKISREISPIETSHTAQISVTDARFQFHDIAVNQVKVLIQKLVNEKSTGIHDIPKKSLKDSALYSLYQYTVKCTQVISKLAKKHLSTRGATKTSEQLPSYYCFTYHCSCVQEDNLSTIV